MIGLILKTQDTKVIKCNPKRAFRPYKTNGSARVITFGKPNQIQS